MESYPRKDKIVPPYKYQWYYVFYDDLNVNTYKGEGEGGGAGNGAKNGEDIGKKRKIRDRGKGMGEGRSKETCSE